jgi:ATP-dependent Clp protease ATP-binding subunit ClpA
MTNKSKFKISDADLEDLIHKYCRDFTELDRMGRYDPITGRDEEVQQSILILLQKGRKNVMLLAPAGVGKTAMVVALSQAINAGKVPDLLKNARVLELDLASMAGGTSGPAEFQGRFLPLCRGIAERYHDPAYPRTILFIDEIHTIMPTVEGSAYRGLSEVMKPYLTVGDLYVIGATTRDEFRLFVAVDPAMDRRFQKVMLEVPDVPQTIQILKNLKAGYEKHHKITIPDSVIERIVVLTNDMMRKRNQPDKSIIIMDSAAAHTVMQHGTGGELQLDSVYYMISKETGVSAGAMGEE